MNRLSHIAWLSLVAFAQPAIAADRPPLVLEPTSDWLLDYAAERCSFYRKFGEGRDAVRLRIDSYGSPIDFRFLVTGPRIPHFEHPTSEMTVRFTPDTQDRETQGLSGRVEGEPAVSFSAAVIPYEDPKSFARLSRSEQEARWTQPEPPALDFEARIRTVDIRFGTRRPIRLVLGNMARPLAAMRDCLDNLQQSWGLDPAVEKSLTRVATPKNSTVRRVQNTYPPTMARNGINAYVPVRIMVDIDGRATDCVIQLDQIDEDFKDAVCDGLERGFEPALDSEGRPVPSIARTSVFYLVNPPD